MNFQETLNKSTYTKEDIVHLLNANKDERTLLFQKAANIKEKSIGNIVYYRGLIEFSNICAKDCLYCGIRKGNKNVIRYNVTDEEIINAAKFAHQNRYGSVVLQSGELMAEVNTARITQLIKAIKSTSNNELGITLSCGEQTEETYNEWFKAGAHRYLLRIESTTKEIYTKIHPNDSTHNFENRLACLNKLQKAGYQTGTGVMIGLPFQSTEHLADDLLFMRKFNVDMVGMGPYIEHKETPLYDYKTELLPLTDRFYLTLKMISVLRIMMPEINMAATTAMQAIDKLGREKAIKAGANIIMPNITPGMYRNDYQLYENKPCTDENAEDCKTCLEARVNLTDHKIGYGQWGDSKHFSHRNEQKV